MAQSPKQPKITANDMIYEAGQEAERLRSIQAALTRIGEIDRPDEAIMRRAEVYAAVADFIARLAPYGDDLREMLLHQPGDVRRALRRKHG